MHKKYKSKHPGITETVEDMMLHSKNVHNTALFFQRRWYDLVKLFQDYCLSNLDAILPDLTQSDIQVLFKRSLATKNTECVQTLYSIYGNASLLEFVSDSETKKTLQSLHIVQGQPRPAGKRQTANDIKNSVEQFIQSGFFLHKTGRDEWQLLQDFIPNLIVVLTETVLNNAKTATIKEKKAMKTATAKVVKPPTIKVKKLARTNTIKDSMPMVNFLPPSYLGFSYMDIFARKTTESYQLISSQSAQQTIWKVDESYASFFKTSVSNAKPPNYNKTSKYNVIFQKQSFKVIPKYEGSGENTKTVGYQLRLALGRETKKKRKESAVPGKTKDSGFLTYDVPLKMLKGKDISEVELVPSQYSTSRSYKVVIKYSIPNPLIKEDDCDNLNKASIDLGMGNLATLFSPCLTTPIIISGRPLMGLNRKYNVITDTIKSHVKTMWRRDSCKQLHYVFSRRSDVIQEFFNKASRMIVDICKNNGISELIVGCNVNWKTGVNMGRRNNRTFYQIPYRKFVNMLFYKCQDAGIKIVENEESYTSKCDALALEGICRHDTYQGKRIKRGLFESAAGVLINADVNGAINIMRKYVEKAYNHLKSALNTFLSGMQRSKICNPITLLIKLEPTLLS